MLLCVRTQVPVFKGMEESSLIGTIDVIMCTYLNYSSSSVRGNDSGYVSATDTRCSNVITMATACNRCGTSRAQLEYARTQI